MGRGRWPYGNGSMVLVYIGWGSTPLPRIFHAPHETLQRYLLIPARCIYKRQTGVNGKSPNT